VIRSGLAIKEAGGWRATGIMVRAGSVTAPLPKEYLPPGAPTLGGARERLVYE